MKRKYANIIRQFGILFFVLGGIFFAISLTVSLVYDDAYDYKTGYRQGLKDAKASALGVLLCWEQAEKHGLKLNDTALELCTNILDAKLAKCGRE